MVEAGCRKSCLQGAFNTSEENRSSPSSRCRTKTSCKQETEPLSLSGQGGIKADQLSCVYGEPIISDSGRKDSPRLQRLSKGAGVLVCATVALRRRLAAVSKQPNTPALTHQVQRPRRRTRAATPAHRLKLGASERRAAAALPWRY